MMVAGATSGGTNGRGSHSEDSECAAIRELHPDLRHHEILSDARSNPLGSPFLLQVEGYLSLSWLSDRRPRRSVISDKGYAGQSRGGWFLKFADTPQPQPAPLRFSAMDSPIEMQTELIGLTGRFGSHDLPNDLL